MPRRIEIACLVGTRPNFVKAAALVEEVRRRPGMSCRLIHSGQHYSPDMSGVFFEELELPRPDVHLGADGASSLQQTAQILHGLEAEFLAHRPNWVVVVGDVTSTLAGAVAAAQMKLPLAHVEAGLRSRDRGMPEELNRIAVDALADQLFASEPSGVDNLLAEGRTPETVHLVGNVMIDTLLRFRQKAAASNVLDRCKLASKGYVVATLHRAANVDDPVRLRGLLGVLDNLAERLPVVLPIHPRTRLRLEAAGLETGGLTVIPPLGYLDFLKLLSEARLVLTDSGGIQEETTILGVPCLTLRENTERPITIEQGTNRLAGVNPDVISGLAAEALSSPLEAKPAPHLWDGAAAARILDILESRTV